LARRQQVVDPLLNIVYGDIETGRDNTGLVDAADKINNDLARSVVIDDLKLTDVTYASMRVVEIATHTFGFEVAAWNMMSTM
jgi:hypothetical protein